MIIITRGLPASGKTTWATAWQAQNPSTRRIVCRDDIRLELFGGTRNSYRCTKEREAKVTYQQETLIRQHVFQDMDVCVADTNLNPKTMKRLINLAKELDEEYLVQSFCYVNLVECLERDEKREDRVGEAVIINMWERYLKNESNIVRIFESTHPFRPSCIVCDLDGTLADNSHRSPYAGEKCGDDKLIQSTYSVLATHYQIYQDIVPIFYASGRQEQHRHIIEDWLRRHKCPFPDSKRLLLRPDGEMKKDWKVKEDMARQILKDYQIMYWLDDRYSVTTHLRSMGITVFSVNFGRF